jgi:hypothetical protein
LHIFRKWSFCAPKASCSSVIMILVLDWILLTMTLSVYNVKRSANTSLWTLKPPQTNKQLIM